MVPRGGRPRGAIVGPVCRESEHGRSVTEVAGDLVCGWHVVNDATIVFGEQLIDDPDRIGEVTGVGLDETLFTRRGDYRRQLWSTQIVDVADGVLLDVVEGRDSVEPCRWFAEQPPQWCDTIGYATLDLSASYRREDQPVETASEWVTEIARDFTDRSMPHEVRRLGRTIGKWHNEIVAWHTARVTNGPTEAVNNLIKRVKRTAFGFRNVAYYRIRALLYAGNINWTLLDTITTPLKREEPLCWAASCPRNRLLSKVSDGIYCNRTHGVDIFCPPMNNEPGSADSKRSFPETSKSIYARW
jgi:hypothetical protein